MILKSSYQVRHEENRMKQEGDVVAARKLFYDRPSKNLIFLLRNRYNWMNRYISPLEDSGIEVGCGIGVSKEFIRAKSYLLTDFDEQEWIDIKNVDALNTPFEDNSFNFVVSSNMIHHLPYPIKFLEEMQRILKPGGFLLIQEINCSLLMRIILRLMRHEGYSYNVDVFDKNSVACDPENLWSGNNAIPNLLFDNLERFKREVPYFNIVKSNFSECLTFLNSGGVTAKTFSVPLPYFALRLLKGIDDFLVFILPQLFALQRQIVLKVNKPTHEL
jgi:SAM-dependent methyltransferase